METVIGPGKYFASVRNPAAFSRRNVVKLKRAPRDQILPHSLFQRSITGMFARGIFRLSIRKYFQRHFQVDSNVTE